MRSFALACLGATILATQADAAIIAQYDFGQASPHTTASNVTASNVTPMNLNVFNVNLLSSSYAGGPTNPILQTAPNFIAQGDLAGAVSRNEYWTLTLAPDPGYYIDLDAVEFLVMRGGTSSTRGFGLYSSLDSFAAPLASVANETGTRASPRLESVSVSGAFDAITSPVSFRFYIFSGSNAQSIDFDTLKFIGSVNAVPEPSVLGLAMLGAVAGLRRRSRD